MRKTPEYVGPAGTATTRPSTGGHQRRTGAAGRTAQLSALEDALARLVRQALDANQSRLAAFIRLGQEDGSVDPALNVEHSALLMLAVLQGMRVVGKAGRQHEEMTAVAALALRLLDRPMTALPATAPCSK
ncbi:hypothetical protein [Candidatus Sodalis pierantonius]|uniref:hypothetical protein n=1 Tax=Candidatus Sodalis pierantonii TaxID=1486991 RepID=UPI00046D26E5|nr:hypothetical protein [Candidatus Sodalis pierantonius]